MQLKTLDQINSICSTLANMSALKKEKVQVEQLVRRYTSYIVCLSLVSSLSRIRRTPQQRISHIVCRQAAECEFISAAARKCDLVCVALMVFTV